MGTLSHIWSRLLRPAAPGVHGSRGAYLVAVRAFRVFLEARGRGAWPVAGIGEGDASGPAVFAEFVRRRLPGAAASSLDVSTGQEAPLLWGWVSRESDIAPWQVVHSGPDAVVFRFTLLNDNAYEIPDILFAAPDEDRLRALLREYDNFLFDRQRNSDDLVVMGPHRIRAERDLGWDDVILPEGQKADIRGAVEAFFGARDAYARLRMPWKRGLLFVGPPGNGKTTLCRVLAARAGWPVVYLLASRSDDPCPVVGDMFEKAKRLAPCAIIVEDLDAISGRHCVSYFLNLMDGFAQNNGLLVIATTNHAEELDSAFLDRPSRFDRVWTIGDPDAACRRAYLARLLDGQPALSELERYVEATQGLSMAYLKEIFLSAALAALGDGVVPVVRPVHVDRALALLRDQHAAAGRRFVERIPLGFGRDEERESAGRP